MLGHDYDRICAVADKLRCSKVGMNASIPHRNSYDVQQIHQNSPY
ncbi:unnamed protein product [Chondrus crispus]|uniref:Uncharacterized protein n=1 Tax=Chondrus crispus TaxID=2769 RepID=R7QIR1_CHOCR|nr:unnamed protein product [Chondrus crispus]CDF37310.1 unnamed protein product [Chondrus crispus]|eukprot:XP_005717129.1 unnamed protein product [Chondrus crispus]